MKRILSLMLIAALALIIFGCSGAEKSGYLFEVELTDGQQMSIVDVNEMGVGIEKGLEVCVLKGEKSIWRTYLGMAHGGWAAYYLYSDGSDEYLLKYSPMMAQGYGTYTYELFRFSESYEVCTVKSGEISFDINDGSNLDVKALSDFYYEVNSLLGGSRLIASSLEGELIIGEKNALTIYRETFSWLDNYGIDYSGCESIEEKLYKFKEKFTP